MKKVVKLAMCMVALFMALNANAKVEKSEILGIWNQTVEEQGITVTSTYDFKADGTMTQIMIMTGTSPKMNVIADGTVKYTLSDDTITFKFSASDINFTVFEIEGLPNEYVEVAKQQMLTGMTNIEQKLTDIQIDGNTLTAKFNGETITLERK